MGLTIIYPHQTVVVFPSHSKGLQPRVPGEFFWGMDRWLMFENLILNFVLWGFEPYLAPKIVLETYTNIQCSLETYCLQLDMCLYVFFGMILWVSPCSTLHLSPVTRNMEVLEKLKTLREERGWKVGLSLSGVGQTKTLEKALKTGLLARIGSWWVAMICFFFSRQLLYERVQWWKRMLWWCLILCFLLMFRLLCPWWFCWYFHICI